MNIAFSLNSYIYFWRSLHFFCWLDLLLLLFPRKRLTWFFTSPVAGVSFRFPRHLFSLIFIDMMCDMVYKYEWVNFSAESDYTLLLRNQKVAFLADALVSSALVTPSRLLPHLLLRKIGNLRENFLAVFILRTHYPTGRTWANICSSTGYASQV